MWEPDGVQPAPNDDGDLESDLFPTKVPNSIAMGLGLFLLLLFAVTVAAAIVVPVPDTIRCQFMLVPESGTDPVRAPREGTLSAILVSETAEVRKGQDLFVIRSEELRKWTAELRTVEQDLAGVGRREALLDEDFRAAVDIQMRKIQQHERDLAFEEETLTAVRDFLHRYEQLDRDGLVSPVELKSRQLEASKGERDVAVARQEREMAAVDLARLKTEHRKQADALALERRKLEVRVATLEKLLDGAREDVVRVTAPFAGTVVVVQKRNTGDVVSFGQELCRIAASGSALFAAIAPPEGGMSRLRLGQRVQLFYQAYPYERFGTGRGTVRWISPASVVSPGGEGFLVRAALDGQTLGSPGAGRMLRAGMRGEARVLAGRRTMIEYVFEPLRKLRETFGARP